MSKKQSIKKRRIASFIALCAFFVCSAQMLAQSQISGTVKDSKGETLIGVSVLVKGTNVGTISDINGNYSVKVSPNAVLQFTSMGYVSQSVNVDNKKNIDIVLVDDNKILDEKNKFQSEHYLFIISKTLVTLTRGLYILGIQAPEKM